MAVPLHENGGRVVYQGSSMSTLHTNLTVLRFGGLALFRASRRLTLKRRIVTFLGRLSAGMEAAMADWIPMQVDLSRRSEVVRLAQICKLTRHQIVGMLLEIWGWFSSESVDGRVDADVDALVDATALPRCFVDAMISVGWLVQSCGRLSVPNWDRWLSKSAKSRVQKNLRQSTWREGKKNVDAHVDAHVDGRAPLQESTVQKKRRGNPPNPLAPRLSIEELLAELPGDPE